MTYAGQALQVRPIKRARAVWRLRAIVVPLTLLALLAWWQADGTRAGVLLDRALEADPAHRLAQLLNDALAGGLAPGWVRRPV